MSGAPRRLHRPLGVAAALAAAALCAGGASAFGLDDVARRARRLAAEDYREPRAVPEWLREISYDQYRDIRFRPERALWRGTGLPFSVQFFHPGLFYERAVAIRVVDRAGNVAPVAFSPDQFDYGRNEFESRVPQDLGFAGFRVHYPIKRESYHDEAAVFLGASYLRAVGRDHVYGISARGLAIDTALASGEEFPWFRAFWLVRPPPGAKELTLYALLDSPSLTGAYRFVVAPGPQTRIDVEMRLFARSGVGKLGIAPLTSMFLRGESSTELEAADYRPEVHDSDGLLVAAASSEWLWRPLANPRRLSVSSFALAGLRGFGLLQRDRSFDHYQDLEARPDLRPSVWVEPKGDWGAGRVELVEIPTRDETNDNVVAHWVPNAELVPGEPLERAYSLYWYGDDRARPPGGRAVATRRDAGTREDALRLIVDFEGGALRRLPEDAVVEGLVSVASASDAGAGARPAELLEQQVIRNPATDGWRLVFQLRPPDDGPVELRAFLRHGDDVLTETWTYLLRP